MTKQWCCPNCRAANVDEVTPDPLQVLTCEFCSQGWKWMHVTHAHATPITENSDPAKYDPADELPYLNLTTRRKGASLVIEADEDTRALLGAMMYDGIPEAEELVITALCNQHYIRVGIPKEWRNPTHDSAGPHFYGIRPQGTKFDCIYTNYAALSFVSFVAALVVLGHCEFKCVKIGGDADAC